MAEIDFDEIEEFYKKSVLGKEEKKNVQKKKKKNFNFMIFFIIALLIIIGIIKLAIPDKSENIQQVSEIKLDKVIQTENLSQDIDPNVEEDIVEIMTDKIEKEDLRSQNSVIEDKTINDTEKVENKEINDVKTVVERKKTDKIVYVIQVTASKDRKAIEKEKNKIEKLGCPAKIIEEGVKYKYKLIVASEFASRDAAENKMESLKKKGQIPAGAWVKTIEKK